MEADDLEEAAKSERPVKYHEAWQRLCGADGVIVPGGFGTRGVEGKILACNWCRTKDVPFLGLCRLSTVFRIGVRGNVSIASGNMYGMLISSPSPQSLMCASHSV